MNARRKIWDTCRALLVAGGVGGLLSGCQLLWWKKDGPVVVADSPLPRSFAPTPPSPPPTSLPPEPGPPPPAPKPGRLSYPVARTVPGRADVVFSPFDNRWVDVAGFKSGSLVADPNYPLSDKKFFRVP